MSKFGMSLFAGLMMLGAVACDDGVADTAENATVCQRACDKLKSCTGNDDKGECRMECVDKSKDDDFESKAKQCNDCLDKDDGCVEKALKCTTECAGVIAVSAST
jgi:hypothetical protein